MTPIPLHGRNGTVRAYTYVDDDDADAVNQHRWFLGRDGYARRAVYVRSVDGRRRTSLLLHRWLLGLLTNDGREGDHINRNKLDNGRSNLRVVTHRQQMQNVSGRSGTSVHRGVCYRRDTKKWRAYCQSGGRRIRLGQFDTEAAAVAAVVAARRESMPFSNEDTPAVGAV